MKEYAYRVERKNLAAADLKWELVDVFDRDRYSPALDALLFVLEGSRTHSKLSQDDREKALMKLLAELNEMGSIRIYDGDGKIMYDITRIDPTATEED